MVQGIVSFSAVENETGTDVKLELDKLTVALGILFNPSKDFSGASVSQAGICRYAYLIKLILV